MVTCVVAKQAKTTKVKNNFIDGKKKFKRILSCLFGGRRKVQFRRRSSGEKFKFALGLHLCCRFFCELGRHTAWVCSISQRFRRRIYSRASAFWFFLSTTMVFAAVRTHFAGKNTSIFMLIGSLSRKKKQVSARGLVD